ncbi:MAG: RNA-binding S4 domain-containing protein [Clostridia bacterium]|jgi:ribosomal 50S subunit-recycling heat shock protein|nr:RNA-binding S4 domain-containing protein [Clostridia bacterium]
MRLDKYLKVARIIKRRTVANEACSEDRVLLNGKEAKPSKEVKPGDIITIGFGNGQKNFKVLSVPEGNVPKSATEMLYEIIE